jgi:hypothetical protein
MSSGVDDSRYSELFVERVQMISNSKRIFILSNENKLLNKGDFISILIEGNLVTRALVAKTTEKRVGIKMMKIYSLALWRQLRNGLDVQIIRGDDSYYQKRVGKVKTEGSDPDDPDADIPSITSEEDLYNTKFLSEYEDDGKRVLPNDNLLAFHYGLYPGNNNSGGGQNYTHWYGTWAYQMSPDVFMEGGFGFSQVANYPDNGINSAVTSISARLKYTFKLPLYSYAQPYAGFMITQVATSNDSSVSANGKLFLSEIEGTEVVFGVTLLRRLVPGWFLKADLGTDLFAAGFAIEF